MIKLRIRKGDTVVVIAGKDKGRTGEVLRVIPKEARVVVSGCNMVKRHTKPSMGNPGGIVEKEARSTFNVAVADPTTKEPTRVGFRTLDDGRKVRFAKRSGEVIDV